MDASNVYHDVSVDGREYDIVIVGGGPAGFGVVNGLKELAGESLKIALIEQSGRFEGSGDASMKHYRTYQIHKTLSECVRDTVAWFRSLANELGNPESTIYYFPYLYIAQTEERLESYRQNLARVQSYGFGQSSQVLSAAEIANRFPFIDKTNNFIGGLLYDDAGWINTTKGCEKITRDNPSVDFYLQTTLEKVLVEDDAIVAVQTNKGNIKTKRVILATGAFTHESTSWIDGAQLNLPMALTELIHVQKAQSFEAGINSLAVDTKLFLVNQGGAYVRLNGTDGVGMYGYSDATAPLVREPEVNPVSDGTLFSDRVFAQLGELVSQYGTRGSHGQLWTEPQNFKAGYIVETPDKLPIVSDTNIHGLYLCGALGHIGVMIHIGLGRMMARLVLENTMENNPFSLYRQYM